MAETAVKSLSTLLCDPVGYGPFWNSQDYYRLVKGSKGSGKTKTIALWYITFMMKYPQANTLVIRKTERSLRDSVYTELLWAIGMLGVQSWWEHSIAPMRLTLKRPNGKNQIIMFKGLDDPLKLASTSVENGYLCWVWFEEFFEITNEDDFDKIDMSIRGLMSDAPGLFKQITCSFNPWSEHCWIKRRFWDNPCTIPGLTVFTCTTTYKNNKFLSDQDRAKYDQMYQINPRMARIVCDGEWGIAEGLVYTNWDDSEFDIREVLKNPKVLTSFGLDFGYAVSYNAFVAMAVNLETHEMWVYDEMYEKGMTNIDIAKKLSRMGYAKEQIWADSAEPKSIYELQGGFLEECTLDNGEKVNVRWALPNIRPALKGPDSLSNGIQNMQSFHIHVHPKCENYIMELNNYCYAQDKDGNFTDKPIKDFDHCLVPGTMVLTPDSEIPIEDMQPGDTVLTSSGPQVVISAGMTQRSQRIWRLTLETGEVLEGTWNHPVVTKSGVKYLKDVLPRDEVIIWSRRHANMMESCGSDTPSLHGGPIGNISSTIPPICTDMSGRSTTDQSQVAHTSTTLTETVRTTASRTCVVSPPSSTHRNTPIPSVGENGAENTSGNTRTSAGNGTVPRKDTDGMWNTQGVCYKSQNTHVSNVEPDSPEKWDSTAFAQTSANLHGEELQVSMMRAEFVRYVVEHSLSTDTPQQGPVLARVLSVSVTENVSDVYDLTVEGSHDFFANGILVLNCMDASRYALAKFYIKGGGRVAEAKGVKGATTIRRSKRVVSSI